MYSPFWQGANELHFRVDSLEEKIHVGLAESVNSNSSNEKIKSGFLKELYEMELALDSSQPSGVDDRVAKTIRKVFIHVRT